MLKTELMIDDMVPVMKLLGDRTRLTIIALLQSKQVCVCEIVAALDMSQPAISQHLRKLRDAKLVKEERRGKWIFYSLNQDIAQYPLIECILEFTPVQTDLLEKMKQADGC